MLERNVALFIHLMGVITLFVAMGIVQRGGARIRAASTVGEMRLWLSLVESTNRMFPAGTLLILVSGLYLAARFWSFRVPWVSVAMASIVVMAVVGGTVIGRGLRRVAGAATGSGPVSEDLARIARRPAPWIAVTALNGMALGVVWIMVRKSGWAESIAVVSLLTALGGVAGIAMTRRREARSARLVEQAGAKESQA